MYLKFSALSGQGHIQLSALLFLNEKIRLKNGILDPSVINVKIKSTIVIGRPNNPAKRLSDVDANEIALRKLESIMLPSTRPRTIGAV